MNLKHPVLDAIYFICLWAVSCMRMILSGSLNDLQAMLSVYVLTSAHSCY